MRSVRRGPNREQFTVVRASLVPMSGGYVEHNEHKQTALLKAYVQFKVSYLFSNAISNLSDLRLVLTTIAIFEMDLTERMITLQKSSTELKTVQPGV